MRLRTRTFACLIVTLVASTGLHAEEKPLYPDVADISHAEPETAAFFSSFFTAKSSHDVEGTMAHYAPDLAASTDATLGWGFNSHKALKDLFTQYMPGWGEGRSYPTKIIGGPDSALVQFTDTPELFGGELHIYSAVDFKDGKAIRWIDYWDSTGFDTPAFEKMLAPAAKFETDFRENVVGVNASQRIRDVSTELQTAFAANDAAAAAALFSADALYEDVALRTQIIGREAIQRYLARVLAKAPFGKGSKLRHVVGGDLGGGFEWFADPASPMKFGITSITLDRDGKIIQATNVYDGRFVASGLKTEMILSSADMR